jgi:glutamine amidotransferase
VIALVDYGAGNLTSVRKALSAVGAEFRTPQAPADLASARGIIVPGVGHFGATRAITDDWRQAIRAAVDGGAALFGICLGMQWLFDGSTEAPDQRGLGYFVGRCELLTDGSTQNLRSEVTKGTQNLERDPTPLRISEKVEGRFKVPHVGWNSLAMPRASALLAGVAQDAQVYFTHSYVAPVCADAAAITTYGAPFCAAVQRGRVAGVQFHPEKSGDVGLRILRNWLERCATSSPS